MKLKILKYPSEEDSSPMLVFSDERPVLPPIRKVDTLPFTGFLITVEIKIRVDTLTSARVLIEKSFM
jgi:hypothetical protein